MKLKTLDRGLVALEVVANSPQPMALGQIANALKTDKSSAFRLLTTLQGRGYIRQCADKRYEFGSKILTLATMAKDHLNLPEKARHFLSELAGQSGETAHLAQLIDGSLYYVDRVISANPVAVTSSIGRQPYGHATSVGKVLLAHLSDEELVRFVKVHPLEPLTANTITDIDALRLHLDRVSKQRYAVDNEERYVGVRCLAAPVFNASGQVIGSIGISGPAQRLQTDQLQPFISQVQSICSRLSQTLGYVGEY